MTVQIKGLEYEYLDDIKDHNTIRTSFMELIKGSFGFDFSKWYQEGYWTKKYEPHVLVKEGEVVATVTVNHMKYRYLGIEKNYLQLGGVLTRKEYRKNGLARWLMEQIVSRYQADCDQIFLLCNDSAVEFYPKFGFEKSVEYIAEYEWQAKMKAGIIVKEVPCQVQKLDMDKAEERKVFTRCYHQLNPFSSFPSVDCEELALFYAMGFRKDDIYYFSTLGVVVVAQIKEDCMMIEDIYGNIKQEEQEDKMELLLTIMDGILRYNNKEGEDIRVQFGFTPIKELEELKMEPLIEEDDTLYLLKGKENLFATNQLRFPILSQN